MHVWCKNRSLGREVAPGSLRSRGTLNDSIRVDDESASGEESADILRSLSDVAFDVHGEARCLWYGETEV
jgi:hypothetical protein